MPDTKSITKQPLLLASITFLITALLAAGVIFYLKQHRLLEARTRVADHIGVHTQALADSIEHSISATYALAAIVKHEGGNPANFEALAAQMLPMYAGVSELVLAPNGVITNVAPLKGNEKAIGLNLLAHPEQRKEALLSRDSGKPTLAGPLNLIQGGLGLIGRLPIFLNDSADYFRCCIV